MNQIFKYPRTQHLRGSRLQPGDEDLADVPFVELAGRFLVVEEKMDGANSGISFDESGKLLLQSRGHYLTGGPRERQFDMFKTWGHAHADRLHAVLGHRYVMYGEWLYAKHTIFYNRLPHYFMEFDILDTETGEFLSTERRQKFLARMPFVASVPVLATGVMPSMAQLLDSLGPSTAIEGQHIMEIRALAEKQKLRADQVVAETDLSVEMEGLYVKIEENGRVMDRFKYVRAGFLQAVEASESHWMDRPIVPNQLAQGVQLF